MASSLHAHINIATPFPRGSTKFLKNLHAFLNHHNHEYIGLINTYWFSLKKTNTFGNYDLVTFLKQKTSQSTGQNQWQDKANESGPMPKFGSQTGTTAGIMLGPTSESDWRAGHGVEVQIFQMRFYINILFPKLEETWF